MDITKKYKQNKLIPQLNICYFSKTITTCKTKTKYINYKLKVHKIINL